MSGSAGTSWNTDAFDVGAYFDAIGLPGLENEGGMPDAELLAQVHRAHVMTFPFSNVEVLLGSHPGVDPASVQRQLVERRRGGYCFEHAQIFAAALEALGFEPVRRLGRVHSPDNTRTHMSVVVPVDGTTWWCDPGFGFSILTPVELADGAESVVGTKVFTVKREDVGGQTTWHLTREGSIEHVMDELAVVPADVRSGHFVTSQEPGSVFREHLMVMRHRDGEHVTVTEAGRTVRPVDGATRKEELDAAGVVEAVVDLGVEMTETERTKLRALVEEMRAG